VCKWACSEEVPEPVDVGGSGFSVAFDPLDGSSIVDTNFSVGTIFGVWPGEGGGCSRAFRLGLRVGLRAWR
jgi:sedoheptulose-bisphosphatase